MKHMGIEHKVTGLEYCKANSGRQIKLFKKVFLCVDIGVNN